MHNANANTNNSRWELSFMAMFQHTLGIFVNPDRAWQGIRNEKQSFLRVYLSHVPLLALIPAICGYIGVTQVGWSIAGGSVIRLTPESALVLVVATYLAQLVTVYALGEYINWKIGRASCRGREEVGEG